MEREFGLTAIAAGRLLGPVLWWTSLREEKRLAGRPQLRTLDHHRTPQLGEDQGAAGPLFGGSVISLGVFRGLR